MIDIRAKNICFACDECGACEQLEHKLQVAHEHGEDLQFDHCSCDKIGTEFFAGGYCEDALSKSLQKGTGVSVKQGVHTDVRCAAELLRSTVTGIIGFTALIFVGIGRATNLFSVPMSSTRRTLQTKRSSREYRTKRCVGATAFPQKGMDTAKSLAIGGRLIRRW